LLKGISLSKNSGDSVEFLNFRSIGTFPFSFKKLVLKQENYILHKSNVVDVGYINLPIIRGLSRTIAFLTRIVDLKKHNGYVIFYSANELNLFLNFVLKLLKLNSCLIMTDPPGWLYKMYSKGRNTKRINLKIISLIMDFNSYVLMSTVMLETLDFLHSKYTEIISGFTDIDIFNYINGQSSYISVDTSEYNVVYGGSLIDDFGMNDFIYDFTKNSSLKLKLHIYGPELEYIKMNKINHPRVFYHGEVSRDKILNAYSNSNFLILPRKSNMLINLFSIPSKTFEYISTGKLVLAYKTEYYKEEFNDVLVYAEDSIVTMLNQIVASKNNIFLNDNRKEDILKFINKHDAKSNGNKLMKMLIHSTKKNILSKS
jgi:hypothetical protein